MSDSDTLRVITDHIAARGYPPTVREIATAQGLSLAAVHRRLGLLVLAGKITRADGVCRGIRVVP